MNKHPKKHHNKAHNPGVLSHKPRSTPCEPPGVQVSGLDTDLYQLTMLAAYLKSGKAEKSATFELFVRNLPPGWGYLTACGIEGALDFLEQVCFDEKQVKWLSNLDVFAGVDPDVFDYMRNYGFRGDVWAMDEGTPVFAEQPILRVTAGIGDAQIVETALLSRINYETLVATKASRVVHAAAGRPVAASAPADAFGVGTKLVTSWDHPALGGIYKLVEFDGRPVMKKGGEKATWPGSKQVFRECDKDGKFLYDTVGHPSENNLPGTPLLCKVMENGKRIRPASDVYAARKRWLENREKLSLDVLRLQDPDPYDVRWSSSITEIRRKLEKEGSNP